MMNLSAIETHWSYTQFNFYRFNEYEMKIVAVIATSRPFCIFQTQRYEEKNVKKLIGTVHDQSNRPVVDRESVKRKENPINL